MPVNDPTFSAMTEENMDLTIVRGHIAAFAPDEQEGMVRVWVGGRIQPFVLRTTVTAVRDFVEADPALTITGL